MRDPKRLALWVHKMHVKDWSPTKNDKLCSRHFDQNLFYTIGTTTCLLDDAVPTIFEELPKYIQEMPRTKQVSQSYFIPQQFLISVAYTFWFSIVKVLCDN